MAIELNNQMNPREVIEDYNRRLSSFIGRTHSISSDEGSALESMLYEIFDLQKKYAANTEISNDLDKLADSIATKLEGLV